MKYILIVLTVLGFYHTESHAQSVNGVPISKIDVEYIQIVGRFRGFSQKMNVELDFGQENKAFSTKDTRITNRKGKTVVFNSMIDALNFMHKNGYDFVEAYTLNISNQMVQHYLLKRRKDKTPTG